MSISLWTTLAVLTSTTNGGTSAQTSSWQEAISTNFAIESFIGSGTFITDTFADAPYFASSLLAEPSYSITEELQISMSLMFFYEWTFFVTPCNQSSSPRPAMGPQENCSDTEEESGNRYNFSDLTIQGTYSPLWNLWGFKFGGGLAFALPTSRESIATKNYFTAQGNLFLSREIFNMNMTLNTAALKFFPQDAATFTSPSASDDYPIGYCRGSEVRNCLLLSGYLPTWRSITGLQITYTHPAFRSFTVSIGLSYIYTQKFAGSSAEERSLATDSNNQPVVTGQVALDQTSGYLDLSYTINEGMLLSLGISSLQPARTLDGKSIRFPFYDFISPANNYSGIYLGYRQQL